MICMRTNYNARTVMKKYITYEDSHTFNSSNGATSFDQYDLIIFHYQWQRQRHKRIFRGKDNRK